MSSVKKSPSGKYHGKEERIEETENGWAGWLSDWWNRRDEEEAKRSSRKHRSRHHDESLEASEGEEEEDSDDREDGEEEKNWCEKMSNQVVAYPGFSKSPHLKPIAFHKSRHLTEISIKGVQKQRQQGRKGLVTIYNGVCIPHPVSKCLLIASVSFALEWAPGQCPQGMDYLFFVKRRTTKKNKKKPHSTLEFTLPFYLGSQIHSGERQTCPLNVPFDSLEENDHLSLVLGFFPRTAASPATPLVPTPGLGSTEGPTAPVPNANTATTTAPITTDGRVGQCLVYAWYMKLHCFI